jgi:toxin ParE1/3/4
MNQVIRTPRAEQDLEEIAIHIGQKNHQAALRFLHAAERAFELLAHMPGIGSPWETTNPKFLDLRFHRIRRYKNYLIFYKLTSDAIVVIRVLHGSRDLETLLGA